MGTAGPSGSKVCILSAVQPQKTGVVKESPPPSHISDMACGQLCHQPLCKADFIQPEGSWPPLPPPPVNAGNFFLKCKMALLFSFKDLPPQFWARLPPTTQPKPSQAVSSEPTAMQPQARWPQGAQGSVEATGSRAQQQAEGKGPQWSGGHLGSESGALKALI